jgi:hypothetical protein
VNSRSASDGPRASAAAAALESVQGARLLWVRDRPASDAKPSFSPCRCTDDRGGRSRRLGVDRRAHRHGAAARKHPTSLRGHRRDACSYDYFEWDDIARHRRFHEPCPAELRVGHRLCGFGHTRLAIGDRRHCNRMFPVRAVVDHRACDWNWSRVSCAAGRSNGAGRSDRGVVGGRNSGCCSAKHVEFARNARFVAG